MRRYTVAKDISPCGSLLSWSSVCLSVSMPVWILSVCRLFVCISVSLSVYLTCCMAVGMLVWVSVCLFVCLSFVYLQVRPFVCMSVVCLYVFR